VWSVHDSVTLERRGIPTVTLSTQRFEQLAHVTASGKGMPDLCHVILPFPFEGLSDAELRGIGRAFAAPVARALVAKQQASYAR